METTTLHRNSIEVAKYIVGIKTYKKIETNRRVRMRQVKIYRNGAWIYCDAFQEEERLKHEEWAQKFLEAMRLNDARQYGQQPAPTTQKLLWDTMMLLREAGLMTNKEAARICLVRFTWTPKQAEEKLAELQEKIKTGDHGRNKPSPVSE